MKRLVSGLLGVVLLLAIADVAESSDRARPCGAVKVAPYEVEVARHKVKCEKARSVARVAFKSFVERPELGDHGMIKGYKCAFASATTPDFSAPVGPVLFCKSWDHHVVASAEPKDPPTNWFFSPMVLSASMAMRYAADKIKREAGRPWTTFKGRSNDCSNRLGRLVRRCRLEWTGGRRVSRPRYAFA